MNAIVCNEMNIYSRFFFFFYKLNINNSNFMLITFMLLSQLSDVLLFSLFSSEINNKNNKQHAS